MYIVSPEKKYKKSKHRVFSCQYHVIFCPKYRRKVLVDGIDTRFKEIANEAAEKYGFDIMEMEVSPDCVHMLIDCDPRFGIEMCVRKIKGMTSRTLRSEFSVLRSKLPTLWTHSYFISTVGAVSLDVVRQYIEDQKGV